MVKITGDVDGFLASKLGDFTATYADQSWSRVQKGKQAGEVLTVNLTVAGRTVTIMRRQSIERDATGWRVYGGGIAPEVFKSIAYAADHVELYFRDLIENGGLRGERGPLL